MSSERIETLLDTTAITLPDTAALGTGGGFAGRKPRKCTHYGYAVEIIGGSGACGATVDIYSSVSRLEKNRIKLGTITVSGTPGVVNPVGTLAPAYGLGTTHWAETTAISGTGCRVQVCAEEMRII